MSRGSYERVSDRAFASAFLVVQVVCALATAVAIAHVPLIRSTLAAARDVLHWAGGIRALAESYDTLLERLERNAQTESTWSGFAETLVLEPCAVCNATQTQSFSSVGVARNRCYRLKMTGPVPRDLVALGSPLLHRRP